MSNLLEEEVICDKLVLHLFAHAAQRVESSLEISIKSVKSCDDLLHDLVSLLSSKSWSEWVVSQVSAYSDSCALDKCSIFWCKGRGLEL